MIMALLSKSTSTSTRLVLAAYVCLVCWVCAVAGMYIEQACCMCSAVFMQLDLPMLCSLGRDHWFNAHALIAQPERLK